METPKLLMSANEHVSMDFPWKNNQKHFLFQNAHNFNLSKTQTQYGKTNTNSEHTLFLFIVVVFLFVSLFLSLLF